MLTRRRILLGLLTVVLVAVGWTCWQTYQVQRDLTEANDAAQRLRASISDDDPAVRRDALGDLRVSAAAARDHSDGIWFGLLTHLPVVGDDATGIRSLSSSIDTLSAGGIQPLADTVDELDDISANGAIDLDAVASLQEPMRRASRAFSSAYADVADLDSTGYAGFLKTRFDDYVDDLADLDQGVRSASKATDVMPDVLGANGPRDYFLAFQNNAEIRATGGLPGSWARVHAEDGRLTIDEQGTAGQFGRLEQPVLPLTDEEEAVYSDLLGVFFQDANFTPDFPRTADLWRAHYQRLNPEIELDGVLSLDPVALSYLLRGTGPITVGDVELTADNAVQQLLNQPYLSLDTTAQDVFFATAAKAIFDGAQGDLQSPVELVKAMSRAADEGRFLFASYDAAVSPDLSGTQVEGALPDDDGTTPHAEVTLVDATASKMSYYLRYRARVTSQSCAADDQQALLGSMTLNQTMSAAEAAALPESVTGAGIYGTEQGLQTVALRLYSPTSGALGKIRIDGAMTDYEPQPLGNRQVATLLIQLDGSDDVVVNWEMTSGPGQTGAGTVGVTPGVTAGTKDSVFTTSC